MLYRVELDYSAREKLKTISDEDYLELRRIVMSLPEKKDDYWSYTETVIDDEGINALLALGIKPALCALKNTYSPKLYKAWSQDINQNAATHIHIPNIGLLTIRYVRLLEDCCTDEVQRQLDAGWRILAICPPNGVRRPDYILGRNEPED